MNVGFINAVIGVFLRDIRAEHTIREISQIGHLSYNATHRTVMFLLKRKLLASRKFGQATAIRLTHHPLTLGYLTTAAYEESTKKCRAVLDALASLAPHSSVQFAVSLDGSSAVVVYANDKKSVQQHYAKLGVSLSFVHRSDFKAISKQHLVLGAERYFREFL